jgi:hypothetical protein
MPRSSRDFDAAVIDAASAAVDQHWAQASFNAAEGGLGLGSVAEVLEAAYVGSRAATHDICLGIRPLQRWEHQSAGTALATAFEHLRQEIDDPALGECQPAHLRQGKLASKVRTKRRHAWQETATAQEHVRLNANSAKGAGTLFGVTPSMTLDMNLSAGEFATNVAGRLGVDVMDAGTPCQMCGAMLDAEGMHCLSCMAGGDAVLEHNAARDVIFDYCERAGLRPKLEAPGLLTDRASGGGWERPADVLVIPHLTLARQLPDGSRAIRAESVCFDLGIVNALGAGHWDQTAVKGGNAAEAYDIAKRSRNGMERRCTEHGLRYWPIVLEQQGGCAKGADAAFRSISSAAASREGREASAILLELRQRLAIVMARLLHQRSHDARDLARATCHGGPQQYEAQDN